MQHLREDGSYPLYIRLPTMCGTTQGARIEFPSIEIALLTRNRTHCQVFPAHIRCIAIHKSNSIQARVDTLPQMSRVNSSAVVILLFTLLAVAASAGQSTSPTSAAAAAARQAKLAAKAGKCDRAHAAANRAARVLKRVSPLNGSEFFGVVRNVVAAAHAAQSGRCKGKNGSTLVSTQQANSGNPGQPGKPGKGPGGEPGQPGQPGTAASFDVGGGGK